MCDLAALVLVLPALGLLWAIQFGQLMALPDDVFPGKHDKLIWGAAFVLLFFFAPFAFCYWKAMYLRRRPAPRPAAAEGGASVPRNGSGRRLALRCWLRRAVVGYGILCLYVLSVGPAALVVRKAGVQSWVFETVYMPLVWLYENTPLAVPLDAYVQMWIGQ